MPKEGLASSEGASFLGGPGACCPRKILKSGPRRMHFQRSGAKLRVFEQNTDIIKFWLFYSVTAHEYIFLFIYFFLPIVMNHCLFQYLF